MAKLLRSRKKFGRCRVRGHGNWCEVSQDIQSTPITRSVDKREWKQEVQKELDE